MLKDKKDDPEKKIPPKFGTFVKSAEYKELLESMLDYCRELFRLENKQQVLEQEAKQRGLPIPQVLPSEKKKLSEKAKKMADKYAWIVFNYKSINNEQMEHCSSFMQFKSKILANQKSDQYFYETMMIFSAKVLQNAFDKSDIPKLEEEINRLFRSNAFNITQRVQFDESRKKKFPQLREPQTKENTTEMIKRLEMRFRIPKENYRQSYLRAKTEIRPLFTRVTPHGAVASRSPLVSMIFPSLKDKMKIFQEESKKNETQKANNSMFVKRAELDRIVEEETKRRNPRDYL
eukprot:403372640